LATIKRFEELEICQESRRLAQEVIRLSKSADLKNDYTLRDQLKGSSGSVMDNIAEGFERDYNLGSSGSFYQRLKDLLENPGLNCIAFLIMNI
jgi:four helix bundle protein